MDLPTYNEVTWWVQSRAYEIKNPRTDGYLGFELKKDLHKLQQLLATTMEGLPTYYGEDEWLEEQRTERAFEKLTR